jgi:hypothetical protein
VETDLATYGAHHKRHEHKIAHSKARHTNCRRATLGTRIAACKGGLDERIDLLHYTLKLCNLHYRKPEGGQKRKHGTTKRIGGAVVFDTKRTKSFLPELVCSGAASAGHGALLLALLVLLGSAGAGALCEQNGRTSQQREAEGRNHDLLHLQFLLVFN